MIEVVWQVIHAELASFPFDPLVPSLPVNPIGPCFVQEGAMHAITNTKSNSLVTFLSFINLNKIKIIINTLFLKSSEWFLCHEFKFHFLKWVMLIQIYPTSQILMRVKV